jgi:uncharacterized protein YlzI (FlbEa/FlbD family)
MAEFVVFATRDGDTPFAVNPELVSRVDFAGVNTIITTIDGKSTGVVGEIPEIVKRLRGEPVE